VTATHSPSFSSRSSARAGSRVVPDPRRFGRRHSGERVISSRRPPAENSQTTLGAAPGGAWSLRSAVRNERRLPGTEP
jgi:hypothetical protein